MTNRKRILRIIIVAILLACGIMGKDTNTVKDEKISKDADLSFVVIGDVHNDTYALKSAIDDFYKLNKNIDALVLNGDTVDEGKDEQYDNVKKVLDKKKNKLPDTIIKNIGNHEFYNYDENTNSVEHMKEFFKKHLNFSGTEKVYNDTWIKDYHFISLGSDDLEDENNNTMQASLTTEQLSWLKESLKENYVQGKPIFVFLHQPINVQFFGNPWYGVKQGNELVKILSEYPEVMLFSSHTHKEFGDDYIQTDMNFTRIHTGAISYTIVKNDESESGYSRESSHNNALYVEVKNNEVILNGRNIADRTWSFSQNILINSNSK